MTAFDLEMIETADEIISEFGVFVAWQQETGLKPPNLAERTSEKEDQADSSVFMSPVVNYDEKWSGLSDLKDSEGVAFVQPFKIKLPNETVFDPLRGARLTFPSGQRLIIDAIVPMISGESIPVYALGLKG